MEVSRNYPAIDELVSSIARIANNLDQMTEIMKKEKQIKNALYGMSVACPLPDLDPEILRKEIQDLKLENDRLKRREKIMLPFLKSVKCAGVDCRKCLCFDDTYPAGRKCVFNRNDIFAELSTTARKLLKELEDL